MSVSDPDPAPDGAAAEPAAGRPFPDPWKSLRGVMAAVLILEAIVVLLGLLVVTKIGDNGAVGVVLVLALGVAMAVAPRYLARPWGLKLVVALQVVLIGCGFFSPAMGLVGVLFGLVWAAILLMRADVARKMARRELPGQRI